MTRALQQLSKLSGSNKYRPNVAASDLFLYILSDRIANLIQGDLHYGRNERLQILSKLLTLAFLDLLWIRCHHVERNQRYPYESKAFPARGFGLHSSTE